MNFARYVIFLFLLALPISVGAQDASLSVLNEFQLAQSYSCGRTCGKVRSCKEAVYQWCVCGYARADGDNDGVPCEKHCGQSSRSSLERVKSYKKELGCR